MTIELKFVEYEPNSRKGKTYSYEKFVGIVNSAIKEAEKRGKNSIGVNWDSVMAIMGFKSKPHSVINHKQTKKLFVDKDGKVHTIAEIEEKLGVHLVGNREKWILGVSKQ